MCTFLSEIANSLYTRFGDDVSSLTLLFPSRRARLFFTQALTQKTERPIWQPNFLTIDEAMSQIAGMRHSDPIKLITELYKVYHRHHPQESFDAFYHWGEMLLADFDQIDKYLINAQMLFSNILELREIEERFHYLSEEQLKVIRSFWENFNEKVNSPEKEHFLTIWRTLPAIYTEFRASLQEQELAYPGMIYRRASELIRGDQAINLERDNTRYIVVGFNALSACEEHLFDWFKKSDTTEFYWDWDPYYVENESHEAGLFLRKNLKEYPTTEGVTTTGHFAKSKEITCVAAPSDALQCKYVHTFLQGLLDKGITPDQNTAIVLTDESLLLPVLYAIPDQIAKVNITMGYPLRQTTAYSFVERLIELQRRKRVGKSSTQLYHSDVEGILNHPYILEGEAEEAARLQKEVLHKGYIYIPSDQLTTAGILAQLFTPTTRWEELALYLRESLSLIALQAEEATDISQRREFFRVIIDHIIQCESSLKESGLEITEGVFASLLRKILQGVRIPYEGEPLAGVQVMGILETRSLDFEHLLVLSVGDDTFPGNRATSSSFVPHNLRLAYGLPTPQHHEGVFAYYFYRLLQRAKTVHLAYCSAADQKRTGEPSRYIYQLDYESAHTLQRTSIPMSVHLQSLQTPAVVKSEHIQQQLQTFLKGGERSLSPSSLYRYIECPLKFYFNSIARIYPPNEINEEMDASTLGTILHKAAQELYQELLHQPNPQEIILSWKGSEKIKACIHRVIQESFHLSGEAFSGEMTLCVGIVYQYITACILPFDARRSNYQVQALEQKIKITHPFTGKQGSLVVNFEGTLDRVDRLNEHTLQIIDYKTGGYPQHAKDLECLFSPIKRDRHSAAFQTLLYSMMLDRTQTEKKTIIPSLYYVREMKKIDYSPLLVCEKKNIDCYDTQKEEFEQLLNNTLSELFDFQKPFSPCSDTKSCEFCDYQQLCNR